ncbi:UDP-N-acetylmuramyl peptide synthase [Legionella maioricensis]|uniref:UDP-N-acetylmuramyl peptide synthase n=1 Tax=Legionella maioricensis TaxID=2896528 RepID=A0A9X2D451_9GAMM|nr:UDP-N-acetylmuramyl peptide synthase [Legionella maioricensis]MCL9685212.1 UDP-N-acetylmuramyl peptide synthase [Legionella maioricensis]MCL9688429.1 UDP-N-acetylmuramyl peptide synthase [Legionella maioricensis]
MFLPVIPVDEINGFALKLGKHSYLFCENETPFNSSSSARISVNKYVSNKLLEMAGLPVPKAIAIHVDEFKQNKTEEMIAHLKFPLVIKPVDGSLGIGVLCNIQTLEQLLFFLPSYFSLYDNLLIEEFHGKLKSYRVLVFNKKVIGVVQRHPARVTGDGKHNIQELIDLTNIQRKEINPFLGPIKIDDEEQIRLKELGIGIDYIPSTGEQIVLCYTSNATRGGSYEALGTQICKENRKIMRRVASVLDLGLTGIDLECADINSPMTQSNGVILEVNHRPSIRIHEFPLAGTPHLVTKQIMRSFIFRHPLSYVYSLYSNKPTAFYLRTLLTLSIIGMVYWLVA